MKNKKERYLVLNGKNFIVKNHSDLFDIGDRKYSDYLFSAKKYVIADCAHNSKNKMGLMLFKRIIHAYLKFMLADLVQTGMTLRVPLKEILTFKIRLLNKTDYSFMEHTDMIHKHVILSAYYYDKFYRLKLDFRAYPTHKFRRSISEAYKNGARYNKLNNDFV